MADLEDIQITTEVQQLLTAEQAWHYRALPKAGGETLSLYLDSQAPESQVAQELMMILGRPVEVEIVATEVIQKGLVKYYRQGQSSNTQSAKGVGADFIDQLFREAIAVDASDIHIETYEERCRVRFRIDGKLLERYVLEREEYPAFINKLKIRAKLDIAEKRLPQDGRIIINDAVNKIDVRVSILPTLHGEKVVMRLLKKDATDIELDRLGLSPEQLKVYLEGIKRPNGIILISGPTGSGKTTTLYATLKILNETTTNVSTIEDPIEYTLEGINQVQVKENIGLTFASALRSFLRQDPDVIMLGEIRDGETAEMAVRAALTGHLVLSTIHTNSAWGTVSRLVDMGVPAYLLSSTLTMSVAQRLVRRLCAHCKEEATVTPEIFPMGYKPIRALDRHFVAKGCEHCHYTGYKGRRALYEIIPIDQELSLSVRNGQFDVSDYLSRKGIKSLAEEAFESLAAGETSIEEVYPLLPAGY